MQRVKLDRIDRRILRDLQAEGRITNVELSRRAGISAPPCLRRVRALEGRIAGGSNGRRLRDRALPLGRDVTLGALLIEVAYRIVTGG